MTQNRTLSLILPAFGAAIIAALAQIVIPIGAVPITLQTFAVGLVAAILKPREATLAATLYLILGAIGLPVFAGGGGKGAGAGPLLCGRHLPFCEKDSQLGGARRRAGTGLPAGWGQESSRGAGDCRPLQRGEFCYKEQRRIGGTAEKPSGIGKETPGFCGSDHLSRRRMGKMRGNSEKTMYKRRSFCYNM